MTGATSRGSIVVGFVIAVIAVLPWIGEIWTRGSLFGFPVYGFLLFLLAPVLLALIAGLGPQVDDIDIEDGER